MKHTNQHSPLVLALVLLIIFTVLILGASSRSMREDEGIALAVTIKDIPTTIQHQLTDVQAPLYFVSFHLWQRVIGHSEFTGRIFSLLTSMLTLSVVYVIGRRWSGNRWAGWAAMLALGFSSYFFIYAIEIRPYAQVMLFGSLSMWFFARWLQERSLRYSLMYAVTVALLLYLHYLALFLVLLQIVYFFLQGRPNWTLWKQGLGAAIVAFVCWLPWFPIFINQVRVIGSMVKDTETRIPGLGVASTTMPTNAQTLSRFVMMATNAQPLLFLAIIVIGLVLLCRKRLYWLALAWGIGVPVVMFLVNLVVPIYEPRYASPLAPGLALLIGLPLAALPGRWKFIAIAVFSVLALFTVRSAVANLVPLRNYLREWNAAYTPGEDVYLDRTGNDNLVWLQYSMYAPKAWPHAQWIDSLAALKSKLLSRCVWHITPDWFNEGVRERFNYIQSTHPLQRVIGEQRYLFQQLCAPPEVKPRQFGETLIFRGVDVESISKTQIVLKVWWNVSKAPAYDYSFGVYLLDPSGKAVAQHDGPINDFWGRGTIQTSALTPGNIYIDHVRIDVPPNLPPGQYRIALKVYQSWDLQELPIDGTDERLLIIESVSLS